LSVVGRRVLLTFGLLSPNKGIEHVLNALPEIVAEFPNTVYIDLGATHPHESRTRGQGCRLGLEAIVKATSLENNAIFHNRFVELSELDPIHRGRGSQTLAQSRARCAGCCAVIRDVSRSLYALLSIGSQAKCGCVRGIIGPREISALTNCTAFKTDIRIPADNHPNRRNLTQSKAARVPQCRSLSGRPRRVLRPRPYQLRSVPRGAGDRTAHRTFCRTFMQISFAAPQAHSLPALISPGRPRRLLQPTVHSQLRARSFLSMVE
jgi:hypothetical protein